MLQKSAKKIIFIHQVKEIKDNDIFNSFLR